MAATINVNMTTNTPDGQLVVVIDSNSNGERASYDVSDLSPTILSKFLLVVLGMAARGVQLDVPQVLN